MKHTVDYIDLPINTYFVYRHNCLTEIDITNIIDGEIFFYLGGNQNNNFDKFYVFCRKNKNTTRVLEIYHQEIGLNVTNKYFIINKLLQYEHEFSNL